MATQQPPETTEQQIDVTAAEWLMIMVTGFTGIFAGPFAVIPGAVVVGMFAYRLNPELMKASAAGKWVRGLLPAPAPEQDVPAQPSSSKAGATATTAQPATRATAAKGKVIKILPVVELERLAQAKTILLVGSRGSGKSTLLRAILATKAAMKESTIAVYDPHAAPGEWPMATLVHNSEDEISKAMASAYKRLAARREERRKGIRLKDWPRLTLAADEWGSIVANVKLPESIDRTPGEVSTDLMKEGRKFDIGFVAGAHGFTNKSLGCTGDQEAFLNSFTWILHMGVFTRSKLPPIYLERWDEMPMGENEEGSTFPLIVACEHRASGEVYLLDMRGLHEMVDTQPVIQPPIMPPQRAKQQPDQAFLSGLLAGNEEPASLPLESNEVTGELPDVHAELPVTNVIVTPRETAIIAAALAGNETLSDISKRLPGYSPRRYKEFKAKVEFVKRILDSEPANEAPASSADDEEEPPSWFGKAFDA